MAGEAGRRALCSVCRQYPRCNGRSLPRVPAAVALVLGYLNESAQGGAVWPWPGDHRAQPLWFLDLMQHARQVRATALRELQRMNLWKT